MKKTALVLMLTTGFSLSTVALAQETKTKPIPQNQTQQKKIPATTASNQGPIETFEVITSKSVVLDINQKNRSLLMQFEDGSKNEVFVDPAATKFDSVKKGDVFLTQFTRVAMIDPNSEAAKAFGTVAGSVKTSTEGAAIDGGIEQFIAFNTTITSVNPAENKVSFIDSNGKAHTVTVLNPELQARLAELKVGQTVRVRLGYSFKVADLTPPSK